MSLALGLRALYLSVYILLAGNGLQHIFLTIYAQKLGFEVFWIGGMGSAYFVGFILGCIRVPRILQSVGHIRTFSSLAAVACSVAMFHALVSEPTMWLIFRFVTGFCLAGLYLSIESWLSAFSKNENRGRVLSKYRLSDLAGTATGQIFLMAFPMDSNVFFMLAILLVLSLVPISMVQVQTPVLLDSKPRHLLGVLKETYARSPLSLAGCFLSGFANGSFWALIPFFVAHQYHNEKLTPIIVLLYLAGGAVSQWPAGHLSDRIDRRAVIGLLALVASSSALLWTWVMDPMGSTPSWSLVFLFLFGAGSMPIYAVSIAHANDAAQKSSIVDLSGLLLLTSSLGSVVGPLLCSGLVKIYGVHNLFAFFSSAQVLLVLIMLYRVLFYRGVTMSEKIAFMDIPETTPMIAVVASDKTSKDTSEKS